MKSRPPPVLVIGAGIGGLVSAIELARRGFDIVVLERAPQVGGKMRRVESGGRLLDAGPTVLTMRWVFEEIFAGAGEPLERHLTLHRIDRLARHAWDGEAVLDLFADIDRSADAIGRFAGAREARGYRAFCAYAQRIFESVEEPFMLSERPTVMSMLGAAGKLGVRGLWRIDGHRTLWRALGDFFDDPRLRQLFARYATYCGSSPFLAPATLNVVAHVEREGVWLVEGGMYRVAEALAALAARSGARIRCGEHVSEITVTSGRASGVRLASGEHIEASAVIVNGDVAALAGGLFGARPGRASQGAGERSLSAVTWAIVAETAGFPLIRHNVFFSSDYEGEFRQIIDQAKLPTDPTVYICAQDRDDNGSASSGPERLLCLINAPATGDTRPPTSSEVLECQTRMESRLRRSGLTLKEPLGPPIVTTPADFERLFPATGGALYGPASHGWRAPFARASSRSRMPGLYVAGGSAHPGAGVPMAALSGRLAAASVTEDLASTRRSTTAVMPGGMSMR